MRICNICHKEKEESEFYKKGKDRFQAYCKSCFNNYCMARWTRRKKDAINYKGGKCSKCGYDKYYQVLEFHHLDPFKKDLDWGKMRLTSWAKIKEELDKCVLVCSNCHKEIHADMGVAELDQQQISNL